MCKLCDMGKLQPTCASRRNFLKTSAAVAAAGATASSFAAGATAKEMESDPTLASLKHCNRPILIKGGAILSMDDRVGNFAVGDVLIDGTKIVDVGARIEAPNAVVIDARGKIVMPGFIDTHHHQFETALRSFLPDGILINDGLPENAINYFDTILQTFSLIYRPEDVYISELFGSIAQLDAGVTTVMDVSQIHHSPDHSDAAIHALCDAGRRAVFGYFEGWGDRAKYPQDAYRIREKWFSSDDQLVNMVMGGEIYLPGYEEAWSVGRDLDLPIALHVVDTFNMQPTFDALGAAGQFGPDNIFIHMTGMSEMGWQYAADAGAHVSLSVPIEMQMRHGMPPIQKALDLGFLPSLSSDVECTMSADFFTQMRSAMTLQRMFANEKALAGEEYPKLLTSLDAIKFATVGGAKGLKLDHKIGTLTPGKEADLIMLDATALNVAPLNNVPGAVVTLMDRTNVDTVMVAGKIKKWKGHLFGFNIPQLRRELERSRDYLFETAGIEKDLFRV